MSTIFGVGFLPLLGGTAQSTDHVSNSENSNYQITTKADATAHLHRTQLLLSVPTEWTYVPSVKSETPEALIPTIDSPHEIFQYVFPHWISFPTLFKGALFGCKASLTTVPRHILWRGIYRSLPVAMTQIVLQYYAEPRDATFGYTY